MHNVRLPALAGGRLGRLPAAFLGAAAFNFITGASLGGLMAARWVTWGSFGPVHGDLNRFGWLTLAIYGMTYAVLRISAGLTPPWPWLGWLHWLAAEAGALCTALGESGPHSLALAGRTLLAVAPTLFLANILSAVRAKRRAGDGHRDGERVHRGSEAEAGATGAGAGARPAAWQLLRRSARFRPTDRIAQRGTDAALMWLLAAGWWNAVSAWRGAPGAGVLAAGISGAQPWTDVWVDYGWIAGTVLSVGLHLHPRFTGRAIARPGWMSLAQAVWWTGVAVTSAAWRWSGWSGGTRWIAVVGGRLLGFALLAVAGVFLWTVRHSGRSGHWQVPPAAAAGWVVGWLFATALGLALALGLNPLSLVAMHLLFLGWATGLVYSVGYSLFPALFGRCGPPAAWAAVQLGFAWAGAVVMAGALWGTVSVWGSQAPGLWAGLLAAGGSAAWLGAVLFFLGWVVNRRPKGLRRLHRRA